MLPKIDRFDTTNGSLGNIYLVKNSYHLTFSIVASYELYA